MLSTPCWRAKRLPPIKQKHSAARSNASGRIEMHVSKVAHGCAALVLAANLVHAQSGKAELPAVQRITHEQLESMVRKDSGNVVLVSAWATWCKPCNEEMPSLVRLRREFRSRPFTLILISADELDL